MTLETIQMIAPLIGAAAVLMIEKGSSMVCDPYCQCERHWRLPRIKYQKVGGLRFLRIGRYQFSFCVCNKSI